MLCHISLQIWHWPYTHFFYRELSWIAFSLIFWPKIKQFLSLILDFFFQNNWFSLNRVKTTINNEEFITFKFHLILIFAPKIGGIEFYTIKFESENLFAGKPTNRGLRPTNVPTSCSRSYSTLEANREKMDGKIFWR